MFTFGLRSNPSGCKMNLASSLTGPIKSETHLPVKWSLLSFKLSVPYLCHWNVFSLTNRTHMLQNEEGLVSRSQTSSITLQCGNQEPQFIKLGTLCWVIIMGHIVIFSILQKRKLRLREVREGSAQGHTGRKRNSKCREQIRSDPRAAASWRTISGAFAGTAPPPTFSLFFQKEQLGLLWPGSFLRHIPSLFLFSKLQAHVLHASPGQAWGLFTQRGVFCPWPRQKGRISEAKPNLIEK